jgi:hypothetical protein
MFLLGHKLGHGLQGAPAGRPGCRREPVQVYARECAYHTLQRSYNAVRRLVGGRREFPLSINGADGRALQGPIGPMIRPLQAALSNLPEELRKFLK